MYKKKELPIYKKKKKTIFYKEQKLQMITFGTKLAIHVNIQIVF